MGIGLQNQSLQSPPRIGFQVGEIYVYVRQEDIEGVWEKVAEAGETRQERREKREGAEKIKRRQKKQKPKRRL